MTGAVRTGLVLSMAAMAVVPVGRVPMPGLSGWPGAAPALAAEFALGALSITVPSNPPAATGSIVAGSTVNITLGTTTVSDTRTAALGWTVSADATAPADTSGHTIAKTALSWTTNNLTATAGSAVGVAGGAGAFGATPVKVATAAPATGLGTYTYTATVKLVVPVDTYASSYTTTITQTIA
jgi:hypothetical protein